MNFIRSTDLSSSPGAFESLRVSLEEATGKVPDGRSVNSVIAGTT